MALSRSLFTNRYGDLRRLMEASEDHNGYGNVTWKVGPHAGPNPYGDDHIVRFVNHGALAGSMHAPEASHEVAQHANDIHQQMDRGDVINVPHVQMKGGKFHLGPAHHGAVQAARQRGADKIPIVMKKADAHNLAFLTGGQERPDPGHGLDPNFKWRWNGHGWYTKPSFNDGRCPQGQAAGPNDKCVGGSSGGAVGGGPAPESMKGKPLPPGAKLPEPKIGGPDAAPPRRKIQVRFKRRGGGYRERPPQEPLPPRRELTDPNAQPVSRADVSAHSSIQKDGGLDRDIFDVAGKRMDDNARAAALRLQEIPGAKHIKVNLNQRFGNGVSGVVFGAGEDQDGTPMVVKIDKGENEVTMANLMLKHPDLGSLPSVPRYAETHDTGMKDPTGLKLHAIYREDLRNFKDDEHRIGSFFGQFGRTVFGPYGDNVSGKARSRDTKRVMKHYLKASERFRRAAMMDPKLKDHFEQVDHDLRKMISRGIVPCDLHGNNWGVRASTGEVVMRDMGCANFSSDVR